MRCRTIAFAADVSLVGERIVGERGNALLEHVVDDRARQLHFAGRLAVLGADRDHVDAAGLLVAHQDRGAIAAAHLEDRLDDRIEQRFDARRARQDVRHLVQRRQVFLRRFEQVRFVLALVDLRQEFELGRIDGALHQRVAARFDDAERGGAAEAAAWAGGRRRCASSQLDHRRADANLVALLQLDGRDPLLVDEGAVGRLQVGHDARVSRAPVIVQCRRDAASSSTTTSQPFSRPSEMVCPVLTATVRPTSLPERTTNSNRMGR